MRLFVTGATGFAGTELTRQLVERGHSVVAYHRSESDASHLDERVEREAGSLLDSDRMALCLNGCDGVYHVAANLSMLHKDREASYETNVLGTKALVAAMRQSGVTKGVYTSSVATLGASFDEYAISETKLGEPWPNLYHYATFKKQAEDIWLAEDLDTCAVLPTTIMGPGDRRCEIGHVFQKIAGSQFPVINDATVSIVDVRDLADGHRLAFERGSRGAKYILSNDNVTLKDLVHTVARYLNVDVPRRSVGRRALRTLASIARAAELLRSNGIGGTSAGVYAYMNRHNRHSNNKAVTELGYSPRPVLETLEEATEWYVDNGFISQPMP